MVWLFNLIATDNKSKNNYDNCIINIKSTRGHQKEEEGGIQYEVINVYE